MKYKDKASFTAAHSEQKMSDWIEEIKKIADLKEMGVLSESEFQQAKLRILSERDVPENSDSGRATPEEWKTIAASQSTIPGVQEWNEGVPVINDPSQRIGSYNILGELGQGGMGVVYRARHIEEGWAQRQGGDVAIKLMHARFARDPSFRERFIREASVGRNVDHPNANKVYEVVIDGDMIGIVMDLIEGHSLQGNIPERGMNLEAALKILEPVASALDHLHGKGIIHRDLKPENIRIRTDGVPIILDFGIAKQENDRSGMTQTGVLMGTVSYMAPEQIDAKNVTASADRYALGVIAYELFSGGKPWSSNLADGRIFAMKLAGNLIHLSKRSSEIPKYIAEAVMRMLSLDPKARFDSCANFIDALKNTGGAQKISMADKLSDMSIEDREQEIIKARRNYTQLMSQISEIELSINSQKQIITTAMRERDERLLLSEKTFSQEKQRLANSQSDETEAQGDRVSQLSSQFEGKRLALIERRNRLNKAVEVAKKRLKKTKAAINESKDSFFSFMNKSKVAQLQSQMREEKEKLNQAVLRLKEAEESLQPAIEELESKMREQIQSTQRESSHEIEQLRLKSSRGLSQARTAYLELKENIRADYSTKSHAAEAIIAGLTIEKEEIEKSINELKNDYPPEVWVLTTIHKIGQEEIEMAQIPRGRFWMGADRDDSAALKDEFPKHEVEITRAFWMATKPINQALFQSLTRKNPSLTKGPRRPVEKVTWITAIEFCNLLSENLGLDKAYVLNKKTKQYEWDTNSEGFRLPTESEWEYCARAGDTTLYSGSDQPGNVAWYADNCGSGVQESGLKRSNKFALYDMSGNIWEWCWDYYGDYTAAFVKDPRGPDTGKRRVRRGGSNRNRLQHIRVSNRAASSQDTTQAGIGFRVVRTLL